MKQADPNSKRSRRRASRSFAGSRPVRRARRRLSTRMSEYDRVASDRAFTKPGSTDHW